MSANENTATQPHAAIEMSEWASGEMGAGEYNTNTCIGVSNSSIPTESKQTQHEHKTHRIRGGGAGKV